ncbi:MAG: sigma-70 family RNA polymerase sigma factor [Phycisphaerales bacterium]|nr:sigma-70 family RNA polymerase sigma factor [Phycisphaerales bacterium]
MKQPIRMALSSDEAAEISDLYDRFAPLVRSLAYDKLADWHASLDVVHDVFLALLNDMVRKRSREQMQAWIVTVARNKIVDRVRSAQRRRERGQIDDQTPGIPVSADEQQQLDQLHAAIAALPENERLMVWLFYLDGVPASRIAEMTGVSLRTVYARLAQARRSLRGELSETRKEAHPCRMNAGNPN